jgi:hypothetical protein
MIFFDEDDAIENFNQDGCKILTSLVAAEVKRVKNIN